MSDFDASASRRNLTTGAKIAIIAAIPLLAIALFKLIAPITEVRTQTGGVFGCGSALNPPNDKFVANICGDINGRARYEAIAFGIAGVGVAVAGIALFGAPVQAGGFAPVAPAAPAAPRPAAPAAAATPAKRPTRPNPEPQAEEDEGSPELGARSAPRTFE